MKADDALDGLVDKVLGYRPKPKGKTREETKIKNKKTKG